jgi:putative DNA primase/helicase
MFEHTELGLSDRLLARAGDSIRHTEEAGWMAYNGQRWVSRGGDLAVRHHAMEAARAVMNEIDTAQGDKRAAAIVKFAGKCAKNSAVKASIELAAPSVMSTLLDFDADPDVFAVANGVIDLRTGAIRPHAPSEMISRISRVAFDPEADCPTWRRVVSDVFCGDEAVIDFFRRAVGYSLTGHQSEQVGFFLTGGDEDQANNGSNGKSLVLSTIESLFGEHCVGISPSTVVEAKGGAGGGGIPNDIAALAGARFAKGSEFKRTDVLNEDRFEALTGDETIQARFLRREYFDFTNVAKLWFATNYMPLILGRDDGIWRRTVIVPFKAKFWEADDERRPDDAPVKDATLKLRLRDELPGILNWALEGARAWYAGGLQIPASLRAAKASKKQDFDALADWMSICIVRDDAGLISAGDVRTCYERWSDGAGIGQREILSATAFGRALNDRGVRKDDDATRRCRTTMRRGARLSDAGRLWLENPTLARQKVAELATNIEGEVVCIEGAKKRVRVVAHLSEKLGEGFTALGIMEQQPMIQAAWNDVA